MKIFSDYTFKWWQMGIFKIGLILFGILVGSYWAEFFQDLWTPILVGSALSVFYISYISFKKLM